MRNIVAIAGCFLVFISSAMLVLMLVEFDIEANQAVFQGKYIEGEVFIENGQPFIKNRDSETLSVLRVKPDFLEEGQLLFGNVIPGTTAMIPDYARPHIPRGVHDLVFAFIGLLVSMTLIAANPKFAYIDVLKRHV